MKSKYKVTEVKRSNASPIIKILVSSSIEEAIFYLAGMPHIVGADVHFNGHLFEMELMPIKATKEMHIHSYWNGICHLCGIYKAHTQEVLELV